MCAPDADTIALAIRVAQRAGFVLRRGVWLCRYHVPQAQA